jgi:hypothetical protein
MAGLTLVLCVALYFGWNVDRLWPSARRLHRVLPLPLVTAIGGRLFGQPWAATAERAIIAGLAAVLLLLAHDQLDSPRPSPGQLTAGTPARENVTMIMFFQLALTVGAILLFQQAGVALLLLFVVGAAYYMPGLGLGRFPGLACALHGAAVASCFVFGAASAGALPRHPWAPLLAAGVLCGGALASMFTAKRFLERDQEPGLDTAQSHHVLSEWTLRVVRGVIAGVTTLVLLVPPLGLGVLRTPATARFALVALAFVPMVLLVLADNKKRAVEGAVWSINIYLAVLLLVIPSR